MPLYRFRVSDASGAVSHILVEGDSREEAARRVRGRNLIPLEFLGEGAAESGESRGWRPARRFDVYDFVDRLVPLLQARVPLERALGIVAEGVDDAYAAQVVNELRRGLHEGRRFSQLIRDRRHLFPPLFANAVEAGEEAGALADVLAQVRRFLHESRELRSFIVSASIYPIVVLSVSFLLVCVLLLVVVPRFAGVLATAGRELPAITRFLMHVSTIFRRFWWVLPVGVVALIALFRETRKETGAVREAWDRLMLRLPVFRRMVLLADLTRMCRTMATLMASGSHLLEVVGIASGVIRNRVLRRSLSGLAGRLRSGERLSQALSQSSLIPPLVIRMVAVGEETGNVEEMLERVADRYEQELRVLIRRTLSLFEPAVILVLGLIVGGIVASMFLAVMEIQSGF